MSRKSIIKDMCDIFESDKAKSPSFTKYCDLGESLSAKDNQQHEDQSSSKSNLAKTLPNVENKNVKDGPNFGNIQEKIGKLYAEDATPRSSTAIGMGRGSVTQSVRRNGFVVKDGENKRTRSLTAKRPNKLNLKLSETQSGYFKSNSSSPKLLSPRTFSKSLVISKTQLKKINAAKNPNRSSGSTDGTVEKMDIEKPLNFTKETTEKRETISKSKPSIPPKAAVMSVGNHSKAKSPIKNAVRKVDNTNKSKPTTPTEDAAEKIEDSKCTSDQERVFPKIPTKPKYINKIKPHPMMSVRSKQDLQEKIKIFNNTANFETQNQNSPNPKLNRGSKYKQTIPQEENSEEKQYDSILTPKQRPTLKRLLNVPEDDSYDSIANRNLKSNSPTTPTSSSGAYDVIQKPPSEACDIVQKPNSTSPNKDDGLYLEIEDKYVHKKKDKNTRFNKNPKLLKNNKNLRAMSKGHSLEDDGYVVVDGVETPDSSDEDVATEYDVIENLNVTKITVERRYKVPSFERKDSTLNVTRETYYDHNLNPRIERISRQVHANAYDETYVARSSLIIQELLQTELAYYKGLLKVYKDYIVYFKESGKICSPNMSNVFGNFEDIYRCQIEFYGELTECNGNVDAIAETFLRNKELFSLYETYIVRKPISTKFSTGECSAAIKARDQELGNKLDLESYLLTPFQRLIRYRMLLKNLQEALQNEHKPCSKLDEAADYLENLIESTNLQVKIMESIRNSPVDLSYKGKLLIADECFLRHNGKKYYSTVILFEDIIVFTRKEADCYIYKGSINLSDLYIRSITEELTSFQLQNFTEFKRKHDNKYVYDLEVTCPKVKQEWVKKIESLLWNQFAAHKRP